MSRRSGRIIYTLSGCSRKSHACEAVSEGAFALAQRSVESLGVQVIDAVCGEAVSVKGPDGMEVCDI
jgi:hypothetical protein